MDHPEATSSSLKRKLDDDNASSDSNGRQSKRPAVSGSHTVSRPISVTPAFVLGRLEYARKCRDANTREIDATRARLGRAKLEIRSVLDKLAKSEAQRVEIDTHIGRVLDYMHAHHIQEPLRVPREGKGELDDTKDDDNSEVADDHGGDDDGDDGESDDNDGGGAVQPARGSDQAEGLS